MVEKDRDTAWSPDSTIRVMVATDIHLGYLENDAVRGEDSFIAFEEVLSLAVQYDVDLILLGGDLFHAAKPSPSCMFKCTQIIRKYCFGDKPISIELLSDQLENFSRNINYEDPNLNVSYPILSIHGNHDDPVGAGSISSLDILSISGLVNYFGKWNDYTHVRISPVLLQKAETKLALYGLSHLKDQRLARLFAENKVEMEFPEDGNDWFNMLVLHQNRADRGPNNYIPERVLPKFLDLVIWGHEHDSEIYPITGHKSDTEGFSVVQPGSTVATSLAAGEALPKHCALLQIHNKDFSLTPIPLKTVRPFIFKTIVLSEENLGQEEVNESEKVKTLLKNKVNEAIEEAQSRLSGEPSQPTLPLVRLSVLYERESQNFNHVRFGQNFNGLVANPNDVLVMKREKKLRERKERATDEEELDMAGVAAAAPDVEALIRDYFLAQPRERRPAVLSVRAMTDAVRDFTLKHDADVFRRALDAHRRRAVAALMDTAAETPADVDDALRDIKRQLDDADDETLRRTLDAAPPAPPPLVPKVVLQQVVVLSDDDEPLATRGRGRGRGAARGGRGAARSSRGARGRGAAASTESPPAAASPPERRTPRRAAQKTTTWLQNISNNRSSRRRHDSSEIEISD